MLMGRKLWFIALLPGYAFGLCAFAVVRFDFCHPLSFLSFSAVLAVYACTCRTGRGLRNFAVVLTLVLPTARRCLRESYQWSGVRL